MKGVPPVTNFMFLLGTTHLNFGAQPFVAPQQGPFPNYPPRPAVANVSGDPLPPYLAVGSDGVLYLGTSSDYEPPLRFTEGRRIFVGVAHKTHTTYVAALREFVSRKESRVFGSDGRVYLECTNADAIAEAQKSGRPMIWAYAARTSEEQRILEELCYHAQDITSRLHS